MPDRPDIPINDAPSDGTPGSGHRLHRVPTHQHLDTDALSAFIDDRLEGDLSLAAAGHIAACADCRRELAELRATVSLLNGLPQYRPRRSFALTQDYAHPVRTSRFARFLPLLPKLQAATVACLLLLLVVGAGDVLTQIGEDSDNSASRSAVPEQAGGDSAFEGGAAAGGSNQGGAGVVSGDGTGGGTTGGEMADQAEDAAPDEAPPPAGDIPAAGFSAAESDDDGEVPAAQDSGSIGAAAPQRAASNAVNDTEATGADGDGLGDAAEADFDVAAESAGEDEAAESMAADNSSDDREPAAAMAEAPEADADSGETSSGQRSAALPAPTTAAANSEAVPTIGISANAPAEPVEDTSGDAAQATASDVAPQGRQSGSASNAGISSWRVIEIVLGVALVVLAALVFTLHRLNTRARRIGIIR